MRPYLCLCLCLCLILALERDDVDISGRPPVLEPDRLLERLPVAEDTSGSVMVASVMGLGTVVMAGLVEEGIGSNLLYLTHSAPFLLMIILHSFNFHCLNFGGGVWLVGGSEVTVSGAGGVVEGGVVEGGEVVVVTVPFVENGGHWN